MPAQPPRQAEQAAFLPRCSQVGQGRAAGCGRRGLGAGSSFSPPSAPSPASVRASLRVCGGPPSLARGLSGAPCPSPALPVPSPARLSPTLPRFPVRGTARRSPEPPGSDTSLRGPLHNFSLLQSCHKQVSPDNGLFQHTVPVAVPGLSPALSLTPGWLWRRMGSFSAVVGGRSKRLCLKHLCISSQMPHLEKKLILRTFSYLSINASRNEFLTSPFSIFLPAINSSLFLFQKVFQTEISMY